MRAAAILILAASAAAADPVVMGQIIDSEGKDGGEVEFAFERLASPEDLTGVPTPVKTDRMGRFSIRLAPGDWRIGDIRKPQKDRRFFEGNLGRELIEVGGGEMYDLGTIRLEKMGSYVTGTVRRAGMPAAGATVEVFLPGSGIPTGVTATAGANGQYELLLPETRGPGRLTLRVHEGDGAAFASTAVDLWKSGTADIAIPERWHELLLDVSAAPEGEIRLFLHPADDPAPYYQHKASPGAKVSIPGLSPGKWAITAVQAGAVAHVEATVPCDALTLKLPAGPRHRLDGRIRISGLARDDDRRFAVLLRPNGEGPAGYLWAPLRADGSFAFPAVAAGRYEISFATGRVYDAMSWFQPDRSVVLQGVMDVSAARTLELDAKASDLK